MFLGKVMLRMMMLLIGAGRRPAHVEPPAANCRAGVETDDRGVAADAYAHALILNFLRRRARRFKRAAYRFTSPHDWVVCRVYAWME